MHKITNIRLSQPLALCYGAFMLFYTAWQLFKNFYVLGVIMLGLYTVSVLILVDHFKKQAVLSIMARFAWIITAIDAFKTYSYWKKLIDVSAYYPTGVRRQRTLNIMLDVALVLLGFLFWTAVMYAAQKKLGDVSTKSVIQAEPVEQEKSEEPIEQEMPLEQILTMNDVRGGDTGEQELAENILSDSSHGET